MMMMQAATLTSSCSAQLGAVGTIGGVVNAGAVSQKCGPWRQRITFRHPRSGLLSLTPKAQENDRPLELYVDYEGKVSVFPDEDCEDSGENCNAEGVFRESKPKTAKAQAVPPRKKASGPEPEYEMYEGKKTVFPGDACDELGGEFCEPEYQEGVYPDKVGTAKK